MRPFIAVCLCVWTGLAAAEPFTIVSYNIWNGFNEKAATTQGVAWIAGQQPDVVALQELVAIGADELSEMARGWGHPHSVILKERGYPVGLTSRTPIDLVERRLEGMHHGYVHARTAGLDFVVVHLAPGSNRLEKRKQELPILQHLILQLRRDGRPTVVLGDFNDVSPLDYLIADRGDTDFTVLQGFLSCALVDSAFLYASHQGRQPRGTYPTRIFTLDRPPEEHEPKTRRIDYILLSPDLALDIASAESPRDPVLDETSDHYPVVLKLER